MAGPIQYQFWLYSTAKGWRNAQPYGPSETFTWTPTWTDAGDYAVQVWVRSNGSTAAYEAYAGTGIFHINARCSADDLHAVPGRGRHARDVERPASRIRA